ncbi:MAG: hypothetical protein GY719_23780 [bacterium]|nr:hypothetical protein [bacterium]
MKTLYVPLIVVVLACSATVVSASATEAVAGGSCTFTLVGTVKDAVCVKIADDPGFPATCEVQLEISAHGKPFDTVAYCFDRTAVDGCGHLQPEDRVLMFGFEEPDGLHVTEVAGLVKPDGYDRTRLEPGPMPENRCSFTLAGTVTRKSCPRDAGSPGFPPCLVWLDVSAQGRFFETVVDCSDPGVIESCRWLLPRDQALILGFEESTGKRATQIAALLTQ